MIDWENKLEPTVLPNGKIRAVGMAMAMQGSGISGVDVGSVTLRMADDGDYNMLLGCTDMGTGCDTILAQMAADCLDCKMEDIAVYASDTDVSPYDSGSYASATTYVTGMACVKACDELRGKILDTGAQMLGLSVEEVEFDGDKVYAVANPERFVTRKDVAYKGQCGSNNELAATVSHSSPTSPPPFITVPVSTAARPSTPTSRGYRPKAVWCRALAWRCTKMSSMTPRASTIPTRLCSIKSRPDWTSARCG